ncbi:hypothetical protein JCM17843_23050 [Kordiimonadales bacterium JCM 17843]|nr:hypothetical protein JCM17843_23050 [Kordiimonadales bacterium JCM 17843]
MTTPPKDLACLLARDRADIAAPILRKVPFSPPELIELVMQSGPEHHIIIAKRADLTLDVWLALARVAARRAQIEDTVKKTAREAPKPVTGFSEAPPPSFEAQQAPEPPQALEPQRTTAEPSRPEKVQEKAAGQMPEQVLEQAPEQVPEQALHHAPTGNGPAPSQTHGHDEHKLISTPYRQPTIEPLIDKSDDSWQFETRRDGTIHRLSPNAEMAFGRAAPSLYGDQFAAALQAHAAAPVDDEISPAMARHRPLRDLIVETRVGQEAPRRWRLRAQPRFSFPDGRFEGYSGSARDMDMAAQPARPPKSPEDLLDRMAYAAERLSLSTTSPELEDYARTMRDCVEALKTMPMSVRISASPMSGITDSD